LDYRFVLGDLFLYLIYVANREMPTREDPSSRRLSELGSKFLSAVWPFLGTLPVQCEASSKVNTLHSCLLLKLL